MKKWSKQLLRTLNRRDIIILTLVVVGEGGNFVDGEEIFLALLVFFSPTFKVLILPLLPSSLSSSSSSSLQYSSSSSSSSSSLLLLSFGMIVNLEFDCSSRFRIHNCESMEKNFYYLYYSSTRIFNIGNNKFAVTDHTINKFLPRIVIF